MFYCYIKTPLTCGVIFVPPRPHLPGLLTGAVGEDQRGRRAEGLQDLSSLGIYAFGCAMTVLQLGKPVYFFALGIV